MTTERESMEVDYLIVGAGPAGLSAAIRLAQLAKENDKELTICVVEKGSEVGAHILSGAVIETRALDELIPDWKEKGAPLHTAAKSDAFYKLSADSQQKMPTPPQMNNEGNYIISLGNLCRWLAEQAEELGVEIFPGYAARDTIIEDNRVCGIVTNDFGIQKNGEHGPNYQAGMEIRAKQTIVAEGCRGSLTKELIKLYKLNDSCDVQTYGIGLKELWKVPEANHDLGSVMHTIGWPLDSKTYGGSFIYHLEDNQVAVGFVIGLDYENTYLDPFQEFQRFKTHPFIRKIFEGGERISYGARAISEGGFQSIPKLSFPGGMLVGDGAGFLNVPKIKGTHTAMKSGMVAAECIFKTMADEPDRILYKPVLKETWVWPELKAVRNIRPGFKKGLTAGLANAAFVTYVTKGKEPWTLSHHQDNKTLKKATDCTPIDYPKPDGKISFDKLSSVHLAATSHDEDQPIHLQLIDPEIAISFNLKDYDAPEQRFCPAGVYEIVEDSDGNKRLQINAANCVHCKTCDIKDMRQNIKWSVPEGGSGPNYPNM